MTDEERIELSESVSLQSLSSPRHRRREQFYRSIFDWADRDHDGFITLEELAEMIRRGSPKRKPLPPSIVRRIHRMYDINHDRRLDFHEFVTMINDSRFRHLFGRYVDAYVKFIVPRKKVDGGTGDEANMVPYEDEYSCYPPRLGMIIISIIELIFFVIDEFKEKDSTKYATGPMAQVFIYDPTRRYEAWRYLTYMFVHIGHLHLIVNLAFQVFIGAPLEMVHGWWRVLIIYFAGVVTGSLGNSIIEPSLKLAGASGGVYSLLTAHVATLILNWKEMSFTLARLVVFLFITAVDIGTSIYYRYWVDPKEYSGCVVHFSGAVAGFLVGINVLRNLKVTKVEIVIWWISAFVYAFLVVFAIGWNLFNTDYFPEAS